MAVVLPDLIRGDTLSPLTMDCSFKDDNDDIISPPGIVTAARIQFRRLDTPSTLPLTDQSLGSGLTYTLVGDLWRFVTDPIILTTSFVGTVEFDLEVTYTENVTSNIMVVTFFQGSTMKVLKDTTR